MKMAKATKDDLKAVIDFFMLIEEFLENRTYTPSDDAEPQPLTDEQLLRLLNERWNRHAAGVCVAWRRVVWGADILIANCCDPDAATLEWRKDIGAFLKHRSAFGRSILWLEDILAAAQSGDDIGFCRHCGNKQSGCEPDACNYECEECGVREVFGVGELLIMGEGQ